MAWTHNTAQGAQGGWVVTAGQPAIALIWAQFAAYHVDRCEAVGRRLGSRAEVLGVEVATTSDTYAWEPSGAIAAARKITLFPGKSYDAVPAWQRFRAMFRVVRGCRMVCLGIGYGSADAILLSWALRLSGVRVIALSESKFDDKPRNVWFEAAKSLVLGGYSAAIVGAGRHRAYFRFLGFRNRPVLVGYDGVGVERIRREGLAANRESPAWEERPYVFVGRFVDKKNLFTLLDGYAAYLHEASDPRDLVLAGSGPLEKALREHAGALGVAGKVRFTGFLPAAAVSRLLADALALVLVSSEEQWGLVINEALSLGLPVIASTAVGARDVLVRNLVNGFVIEPQSAESLAEAMRLLASDEARWRRMSAASNERAWLGDADRLADAIEFLFDPPATEAAARIGASIEQLEPLDQ